MTEPIGIPAQNCAYEICCGEDLEKQIRAMKEVLHHYLGHGPYTADQIATFVCQTYDLAPKGTLYAFKQAVKAYALGPTYEG